MSVQFDLPRTKQSPLKVSKADLAREKLKLNIRYKKLEMLFFIIMSKSADKANHDHGGESYYLTNGKGCYRCEQPNGSVL